MKLLGKNKENSIENLSNGPGAEVGTRMFTNKYLIRLLWPLFCGAAAGICYRDRRFLYGGKRWRRSGICCFTGGFHYDAFDHHHDGTGHRWRSGSRSVPGTEKRSERRRKAGDQLLLFVTALSLIIVAVMYIFRKGLLPLVFGDVEPQVMAYCDTYYKIVVATVPLIAVYNAGAALFRSIGNSKIAMKISLLMNVINISGNAVLLYGFHCGVEGVAIPTLAARFVAALIVIKALRNPDLAVHLGSFVWRPNWKLIKNILRIGIPNGIENSMFQLGKLLLLSMISGFGTTAIAANAVANTVAMIAVLPGMAVGYGIVSVISQCVGSGDYEQVRYYGRKLIKWVYLLMGIVDILIILLIPVIIDLYGLSEATGDLAGKIILFHNICAIVIWPISFSLPNVLRAASDVMYTMIIGVGSMWVFRILSGYLLGSVLGMGVFGVWVAMIIDWVVRSVCFLIRYHGGKWKHPAVR